MYGGSSRSLGILLPFLKERGVEPYIVAPPGRANDYFRETNENVITLDSHSFPLTMTVVGMSHNRYHFVRSTLMTRNVGRIKKVIQDVQPDLVHCNELGLVAVAKLAGHLGYPVVMHARTMPHKSYPRINQFIVDRLNRYSAHTICITGSVANSLSGVKRKSIVYNPIESFPEPVQRSPESTPVRFLSLSAIQESKGVFDIVEAAHLLKDDPRIQIQIAGRLIPHDPKDLTLKQRILVAMGILDFESTNRLLKLIDSYQLKNVELLGHVDDIDRAIRETDVVLAPMHLNAPPRSVYEAGAHGLPSILSMDDKVEDVVENGVTGFLIDEQSPEQLAETMLKLVEDPELRLRMGQAAQSAA